MGPDELRHIRTRCLAASVDSQDQHEVFNRTGVAHRCAAAPESESVTVLQTGHETLPTIGDVGQT